MIFFFRPKGLCRITEQFRLEGTSGGQLIQHPESKQAQLDQVAA